MRLPHSQRELPMSSLFSLHFPRARRACWMISCLCCSLLTPFLAKIALSQETPIAVRGELQKELSLSLADIKAMPPFLIRDVPVIPERVRDRKDQEKVTQTTFRGVLLRDVLWKAGLKYKRKWEPGVFIQVRNRNSREIVFSFGEIFYSSIGRSVLIAYEREELPCAPTLVVATDIHDGRMMTDLTEIKVSRVDVELLAYEDQEKKKVRPPSAEFTLVDQASKIQRVMKPADLKALPKIHIPAAVMIGECEGFHGIHSLDGVPLSTFLNKILTIPDPAPYNRYVLITSDDGYCATYSFGELFNSRLGDQVVIATIKDGKPLSPTDGFAMSVTGEDSTGGRSVKRIKKIEVR
jgi:DMSO/TMAO reductase YedYZ molybdopterin-dependent catalytic subunit